MFYRRGERKDSNKDVSRSFESKMCGYTANLNRRNRNVTEFPGLSKYFRFDFKLERNVQIRSSLCLRLSQVVTRDSHG